MTIYIKNGRVIDPKNNIDEIRNILIQDGIIIKNQSDEITGISFDKIIDAQNMWVVPGFIDIHVHLRQPGFEYKETLETGSRAAAKGGFTTICCMPNTKPVLDHGEIIQNIINQSKSECVVNVIPIGSITKSQQGEILTDLEELKNAGICGISEDGKTVDNSYLMKLALRNAREHSLPVFSHCEDLLLTGKGQINEGPVSEELKMEGISNDSEYLIVSRDILLNKEIGANLHICHVSTEESVAFIRQAKNEGYPITAEVTPHHFTLIDQDIKTYDANFKMAPPLRSEKDRQALLKGLKDNTIEVIATDHAPHHEDEKNNSFEEAPNGIVGLETAFSLGYSELVLKGILTPSELISKMTINPAHIIQSDRGTLSEGSIGDVVVLDVQKEYLIDITSFESKSNNSPFHGRRVKGSVEYTIVSGEIIVECGQVIK